MQIKGLGNHHFIIYEFLGHDYKQILCWTLVHIDETDRQANLLTL